MPTRTPSPTPEPTLTPEPTPEHLALPFDEICEKDRVLTDVQMEAYLATFVGKEVVGWTGWVYDVTDRFGEIVVLIAMDPPGGFLWSRDIELYGVPDDVAIGLNKEQKVTFSGRIREVETFLGTVCNPLAIEEATVEAQ